MRREREEEIEETGKGGRGRRRSWIQFPVTTVVHFPLAMTKAQSFYTTIFYLFKQLLQSHDFIFCSLPLCLKLF